MANDILCIYSTSGLGTWMVPSLSEGNWEPLLVTEVRVNLTQAGNVTDRLFTSSMNAMHPWIVAEQMLVMKSMVVPALISGNMIVAKVGSVYLSSIEYFWVSLSRHIFFKIIFFQENSILTRTLALIVSITGKWSVL